MKAIINIVIIAFALNFAYVSAQPVTERIWRETAPLSSLNSPSDDFAPSFNKWQKRLYFNSNVSSYSMFYSSGLEINENGAYSFLTPEMVKGDINRKNNNQSYISFPQENLAYLSTFRLSAARSQLNIFYSRLRRDEWIEAIILDSLSSDSFSAHATVSSEGDVLIFSSNRSAPDKDLDLWVAYKQENGSWGDIEPLQDLNSPGNEITPHLASRDTLYFASDGQEGPGGYDLYVSAFKDGRWQRPKPLYDINSEFNESDFAQINDEAAVFSSDRPQGKGGLDLYICFRKARSQYQPPAQDNSINIISELSEIRAKNSILYKRLPLPSYITAEKKNLLDDESFVVSPYFQAPFSWNYDSLYYYAPSIIAQRMAAGFDTLIINRSQSLESKALSDKLSEYLISRWSIPSVRIKVEEGLKKLENYVFLSSSQESLFSPLQLLKNNIELNPGVLGVTVDSPRQNDIALWSMDMFMNDERYGQVAVGESLPIKVELELGTLKEEIYYSDSLRLSAEAFEKNGKSIKGAITFNIAHNQTRETETINIEGNSYRHFPLMIIDKSDIMSASIEPAVNIIAESLYPLNYYIIQYSDYKLEGAAKSLAEFIKRKSPDSNYSLIYQESSSENKKWLLNIYVMKPSIDK